MSNLTDEMKFFYMNSAHNGSTIKAILMATGFTYDQATQLIYSDISASELAAGNGYLQDTAVLSNVVIAKNIVLHQAEFTADDYVWTASGGDIGPSAGILLYDVTQTNRIIGYQAFAADRTATDGNTFTVSITSFILGDV